MQTKGCISDEAPDGGNRTRASNHS